MLNMICIPMPLELCVIHLDRSSLFIDAGQGSELSKVKLLSVVTPENPFEVESEEG